MTCQWWWLNSLKEDWAEDDIGSSKKSCSMKVKKKCKKKMKMILQKDENLVHIQQQYSVSFYKKIDSTLTMPWPWQFQIKRKKVVWRVVLTLFDNLLSVRNRENGWENDNMARGVMASGAWQMSGGLTLSRWQLNVNPNFFSRFEGGRLILSTRCTASQTNFRCSMRAATFIVRYSIYGWNNPLQNSYRRNCSSL